MRCFATPFQLLFMIQIEDSIITELALHRVGPEDDHAVYSDTLADFEDAQEDALLKKMFLKPFQSHAYTFEFAHDINLDYNVLFNLCKSIQEGSDFRTQSADIARHLQSVSKHPNIKEGDLFIVRFQDVMVKNRHYEAIGIYKFEDKESFIDTSYNSRTQMKLGFRKGLASKRPDKACLVILDDAPYTILVIDSNSGETDYWQNEFIKHRSKNDFVNNTTNFLTLAKSFITEQIPSEYDVTRADQLDLLNRSVEYFKSRETFSKEEFEAEVFQEEVVINSFRKFDEQYRKDFNMELSDEFDIAQQAVKKQARVFKSVLKLDKNFHIYIHGDRDLIEQGTDADGRKFYKIYYTEEH